MNADWTTRKTATAVTLLNNVSTADNRNMLNATYQDIYYREGEYNGEPKYQTVHGNLFMQWAKICPVEAE